MYAVVRQYSSSTDLRDIIRQKHQSLEESMKSLPGFVSYQLISDGTSVTTITVCNDQAGADASMQKAADWVKQNLPADSGLGSPQVTRGEVLAKA
jgi:hypothetical protein